MISPLEANYWNLILREQNAQAEIDRIKQSLNLPNSSARLITRAIGAIRTSRLKKDLPDIDRRIKLLESQIDFVERPRARNRIWKP